MGSFLSILSKQRKPRAQLQFFTENSISKIKQFYSLYKNNSDNLTIDNTEFEQIFGAKYSVFQVLDTDKNLLINSLQLFAGLVLFSRIIKFQDKIEFLFSIFDFNDLKSLSKTDLQFALLSCCQVVYKLFHLKQEIKEEVISEFVHEQFRGDKRINISEILKWAKSCQYVIAFFEMIDKKPKISLGSIQSRKIFLKHFEKRDKEVIKSNKQLEKIQQEWLIANNKVFQDVKHLQNAKRNSKFYHCDLKPKINWVYGIRSKDTKQFIDCLKIEGKCWMVYFVSKLVVLFNLESSQQLHYSGHSNEVISITSSSDKSSLVASGEYCPKGYSSSTIKQHQNSENQPSIKIWDVRTMNTVATLKGVHTTGIHLLKFIKNDEFLVSCGISQKSPILIYSLKTFQLVDSFYVESPAVDISPMFSYIKNKAGDGINSSWDSEYLQTYSKQKEQKELRSTKLKTKQIDSFVVASLYGIKVFTVETAGSDQKIQIYHQDIDVACYSFNKSGMMNQTMRANHSRDQGRRESQSVITSANQKVSRITCCSFFQINSSFKYLSEYDEKRQRYIITGHEKGQVNVIRLDNNSIHNLLSSNKLSHSSKLWFSQQNAFNLSHEKSQIVKILPTQNSILIATDSSYLDFWDLNLLEKKKIKTIDITQISQQFACYDVSQVVLIPQTNHNGKLNTTQLSLNPQKINTCLQPKYTFLVTTNQNDIFLLGEQKYSESIMRYKLLPAKYQAKLIRNIFSIKGTISSHKIVTKELIGKSMMYIAGSQGTVWVIDMDTHQIVQTWNVGEQIVAMDVVDNTKQRRSSNIRQKVEHAQVILNVEQKRQKSNLQYQGTLVMVGTVSGKVVFRINFLENKEKLIFQHPIKCILISPDHNFAVIGCKDSYLYVLQNNHKNANVQPSSNSDSSQSVTTINGIPFGLGYANYTNYGYFSIHKKIMLPQVPISITFLDKKLLSVTTTQNKIFFVSLKDSHYKLAQTSTQSLKNSVIKNCFYVRQKNVSVPLIMGSDLKAFALSKIDGNIDIWKNKSCLAEGNKLSLVGHSSYCSSISVSDNQKRLYSSGIQDHMVVSWDLNFFVQSQKVICPGKIEIHSEFEEQITQNEDVTEDRANKLLMEDQILQREISFSIFNNNVLTQTYDQHLLVRGIEDQTLCKLLKGMNDEWRHSNNVSHLTANASKIDPKKTVNSDTSNKPFLNANGSSDTNESYPRNYVDNRNPPNINIKLQYVFGIQTFNKRFTVFALSNPKRFLFFISRLVVIYNPATNHQSIYSGHQYKITCITPINLKKDSIQKNLCNLVTSAESAYRPTIRIWDYNTLQTKRVIETIHRYGIIHVISMNEVILSYGFDAQYQQNAPIFSLQMTDIETGQIIASRTLKDIVYFMALDPVNSKKFITTGFNNITFWTISKQRNILREGVCYPYQEGSFTSSSLITCALYYKIGNQQSVVMTGSKKGAIGIVYQQTKYIEIKQLAHIKSINSISLIKKKQKQPMFITVAEDETIKIWNKKFDLLYEQNIRKIDFEQHWKYFNQKKISEKNTERNLSIQSISSIGQQNSNQINFLLGTRNGDVIQLVEDIDSLSHNQQNGTEHGDFKYILYLKNHSSQHQGIQRKKVIISHHPKYQIVVSIAQDQNLLFWDTEKNKLIMNKTLGYTSAYPTAIKFNKDGEFLIVGYSDGLLIFLDSKISKSIQGKNDDKFILPSLSIVRRQPSKEGAAVLNIEISDSGDHLAVSFNNKIVSSSDNSKSSQNEHSYISLFLNKNREKAKHFNKIENDKIFEKFTSISRQHAQNIFITEKNNKYGLAAYSMAFAQSEGKFYLLIYYQLVDSNQNRLNFSRDGKYVVWDVNTSTVIANLDLISGLNWKKFCFPNSIYCKYQLYQSDLLQTFNAPNNRSSQEKPTNNNLLIPHISSMINIQSSNSLALGSVNGDIHLVRTSALQYDNIFQHRPAENQMFIAKTFPAHCSQVNQLQINPDRSIFYSTSLSDQCIFKWKISGTNEVISIPQNTLQTGNSLHGQFKTTSNRNANEALDSQKLYEENDLFGEVPTKEALVTNYDFYQRKQGLLNRTYVPSDFLDRLIVSDVIGRKAFSIRNNLRYDCKGRILYPIGQTLVAYDGRHNKKDFMYIQDDQNSKTNQITFFTMSSDRMFAYTCHAGKSASIVIWEANSKQLIHKLLLSDFCIIFNLCLSDSNKKAIALVLDKQRSLSLIMIDLEAFKVLGVASYRHARPWTIKSIVFLPNSQNKFITCGVEQTKCWQLIGAMLTYKQFTGDFGFQSTSIDSQIENQHRSSTNSQNFKSQPHSAQNAKKTIAYQNTHLNGLQHGFPANFNTNTRGLNLKGIIKQPINSNQNSKPIALCMTFLRLKSQKLQQQLNKRKARKLKKVSSRPIAQKNQEQTLNNQKLTKTEKYRNYTSLKKSRRDVFKERTEINHEQLKLKKKLSSKVDMQSSEMIQKEKADKNYSLFNFRLVTGFQDGSIILWDKEQIIRKNQHQDMVLSLATQYCHSFKSQDQFQNFEVYTIQDTQKSSLQKGKCSQNFAEQQMQQYSRKRMIQNLLISGSRDGTIIIWLFQSQNISPLKKIVLNQLLIKNISNNNSKNQRQKLDSDSKYKRQISKHYQVDQHGENSIIKSQICCEVQSLQLYNGNILIGSRSGNIYQYKRQHLQQLFAQKVGEKRRLANSKQADTQNPLLKQTSNSNFRSQAKQQRSNQVQLAGKYFEFHDNQTPKSFFFTELQGHDYLYEITNKGQLSIWRFSQYQKVWMFHFRQETVEFLISKRNNIYYIAFQQEIKVFPLMIHHQTYKLNQSTIIYSHLMKNITHMKISANQKMLAIGVQKIQEKRRLIQIYDVEKVEARQGFKIMFRIDVNSELDFFDFSKNNKYFMVKSFDSSVLVRDLSTKKNITNGQNMKIQWQSDGIIYSEASSKIKQAFHERHNYLASSSSQFKISQSSHTKGTYQQKQKTQIMGLGCEQAIRIMKIIAVGNDSDRYIVVDEFGGVFVYAGEGIFISQLRMSVTEISKVVVSGNARFLAIGSQFDRSISIIKIGNIYY